MGGAHGWDSQEEQSIAAVSAVGFPRLMASHEDEANHAGQGGNLEEGYHFDDVVHDLSPGWSVREAYDIKLPIRVMRRLRDSRLENAILCKIHVNQCVEINISVMRNVASDWWNVFFTKWAAQQSVAVGIRTAKGRSSWADTTIDGRGARSTSLLLTFGGRLRGG